MSHSHRMFKTPIPERPVLDSLIKAAKDHVLSKEEIDAQRKSWVIGGMLIHSDISKEGAERLVDSVLDNKDR